MKVAALAGGVGGAKLLVGLDDALAAGRRGAGGGELTAIVNTGDDALIYGVHVSPDVDIVTYWLADLADTQRGWGLVGDTFEVVGALERLGAEAWFRLGDRDLATCLHRTERLRAGASLSSVTDAIRRSLGVTATVLPMSDDRVRTMIRCFDGRRLEFQEYFVKERTEPDVVGVDLDGVDDAKPAPGVLDALDEADLVIVCPSNPLLSIAPIIALKGVKERLTAHGAVVAVSPIVRGRALKGPAAKLLSGIGIGASASGVASLYREFCDVFVVDASDADQLEPIQRLGMRAVALQTVMDDREASVRLAGRLLDL